MTKRRFLLAALTVFLIALAIGWLVLPSRVAYFTLDKRLRIELNGVPVKGEALGNRFSAIVTIRDVGKKHSYQLFYAGDVDMTGDMRLVVACRHWVAPQFLCCFKRAIIRPASAYRRLPGRNWFVKSCCGDG